MERRNESAESALLKFAISCSRPCENMRLLTLTGTTSKNGRRPLIYFRRDLLAVLIIFIVSFSSLLGAGNAFQVLAFHASPISSEVSVAHGRRTAVVAVQPANYCSSSVDAANRFEHRHRHQCRRRVIFRSKQIEKGSSLFSSSGNSQLESPSNSKNGKSPKKWYQQPITWFKRAILKLVTFLLTAPEKFKSYYGKLSKKGKIVLGVQLVMLGMVVGLGVKSSSEAHARSANRPIEVGYSTFLDLVDVNGKVRCVLP